MSFMTHEFKSHSFLIVTKMKLSLANLKLVIAEAATRGEKSDTEERDEIASLYSDTFKEKNGIRPRWMKWDKMSTTEMRAELERLYDEPKDPYFDDQDYKYEYGGQDVDWNDDENLATYPDMMTGDEVDFPTKIPMKGGNEMDALSKKSKGLHSWRPGQRKTAKNTYNRRLRRT